MKIVFILLAGLFWQDLPLMAAEANTGQQVFQNMCSRCHKLPAAEKRTTAQWQIIIDVMQQVMSQRGETMLTDAQKQQILDYLANNSRQANQEQASASKDMFVARCALCHQLPEPDMLRLPQWKFIIQTMQQRMQQKDIPPLNEKERKQILGHLAAQANK